jgi:prepilin signal peptidase PulO-like enzyme (type II secretory pathway)|tara:strand:- start:237 stop:497 length:261 start_codon:yes stop_codon:yes gene_type:complete
MHKYWFRPKRYGYGFYPISWEGWLATLILVVLILVAGAVNGVFEEGATAHQGARFSFDVFLIAGIATLFFERKMKEPLRWRWGRRK